MPCSRLLSSFIDESHPLRHEALAWLDVELTQFYYEWWMDYADDDMKFGEARVGDGEDDPWIDGISFAPFHRVEIQNLIAVRN